MHIIQKIFLVCLVLSCHACATAKLWEDTNPNERIWIDASKATESELKKRRVSYQIVNDEQCKGYLVRKNSMGKMKDYQLRLLGTPVTLVVDAAATVVVVGVYILLTNPVGTCSLIEGLVDDHNGHHDHKAGHSAQHATGYARP